MCSNYTLKVKAIELQKFLPLQEPVVEDINQRFLPYQAAPVVVRLKDSKLKLAAMNFSLVPSWSKERKVKFATHNARIETITEKPTWRVPFQRQHCIVPMTGFYEAVYEGPKAGNIIEFSETGDHLMLAAGIYDQWIDPETKKSLHSFSILTTTPTEYIQQNGHDRSPIFLSAEAAKRWLETEDQSERYWLDFINKEHIRPPLKIAIDRPLKAGWEKRK